MDVFRVRIGTPMTLPPEAIRVIAAELQKAVEHL